MHNAIFVFTTGLATPAWVLKGNTSDDANIVFLPFLMKESNLSSNVSSFKDETKQYCKWSRVSRNNLNYEEKVQKAFSLIYICTRPTHC